MSALEHQELGGGMLLHVDAWGFAPCEDPMCEEGVGPHEHPVDFAPMITFFWNVGIAIALAASRQDGMVARPINERHAHRQKQIEKLRHAIDRLVEWERPVEVLAIEAEVMHREVARLRGELAAIARLKIGIASERARRALEGEPTSEAA